MSVRFALEALRRRFVDHETSACEQIESLIAREAELTQLGALLELNRTRARERAAQLDRAREQGDSLGPLAGVPVAIKANISAAGWLTSCGSRELANYRAPYSASAVERLEAAGAILAASMNCDEFAMGSSTENSGFCVARNPHDPTRVPGGSSGGSAIAVATGWVPLALGSDTGGSVRQPAAFCGVVGLKPTYGRVSRWGLVAYGSSLDQIGPLTPDVRSAARCLEVIAGHDERDDTSDPSATISWTESCEQGVRGLRVGWCRELSESQTVDPPIRRAIEQAARAFEREGALVAECRLSGLEAAISTYYLIAMAEASSNLARFDGVRFGQRVERAHLNEMYCQTRTAGLGAEVRRRIMLGTFALTAGYRDDYFGKAQQVRAVLREQLDQLTRDHDLLLLPTTPTLPFQLGERLRDPWAMYLSDLFTVLANLGGHPAISLPAPVELSSLPIGVQLIARRGDESSLFRAASQLEAVGFARTPRAA